MRSPFTLLNFCFKNLTIFTITRSPVNGVCAKSLQITPTAARHFTKQGFYIQSSTYLITGTTGSVEQGFDEYAAQGPLRETLRGRKVKLLVQLNMGSMSMRRRVLCERPCGDGRKEATGLPFSQQRYILRNRGFTSIRRCI